MTTLNKKRTRIDYNTISQAEAIHLLRSLLRNHKLCPTRACRLFLGSLNTDGYSQVQQKNFASTGRKRNLLGHILALRAAGRDAPREGQHASHLCDQRNCFEQQHIVVESVQANNLRKGCPGDVACTHCTEIAYHCPHVPKCIRKK